MGVTGIHHVSLKCSRKEYDDVIRLYEELFGFMVYKQLKNGALLDTGNGFIEIFNDGEILEKGAIRHFALEVTSTDEMLENARKYGCKVIMEPKDVDLNGLKARVAFILGNANEEIEFFEVKKNG